MSAILQADLGRLDLSCRDWRERIVAGKSLIPAGLRLDAANADNAREIFSYLHLPDVPQQPTFGEVGALWFDELVGAVFGSWDGELRWVNEFFWMISKKQAKTTGSAGIMVTALIVNKRPAADFLLIAPTQGIAELAFSQAVGMIEADVELKKVFHVKDYTKLITHRRNKATLQIKSFDPSCVTGTKPAGVLLDELHVIAEHKSADRVLRQIRGGMLSQPEAFLIMTTTQSERAPSGVFRAELIKARKVRDGLLSLPTLPIIYEFPESMIEDGSWQDSKNWWMVAPNLGKSITLRGLENLYASAVAAGEEEVRGWATQHLNIQIGTALKNDAWQGAAYWDKSTCKDLTLDKLLEESDVVTLGIDGGGLDDMLALAVCGRRADNEQWQLWSHAWLHEKAVERRKSSEQHYRDFAEEGSLTIVDTLGDDLAQLGDYVEQVVGSGKLALEQAVGVDQSGLGMIEDELVYRGVDKEKQIVGVSQGWRLTSAIKALERALAQGTAVHADQALTRWSAENAKIEPRGNAILITKQVNGSAKIDPVLAMLNAVELMSRNPAAAPKYQMVIL